MVLIRPFEDRDNTAMLEIEKFCTQGNEKLAMGVDKSPDIIARYKLYDNWQVLVAEEEGRIVGWTGWTVKHDPIKEEKYIYMTEMMIHPEFRRKGIATKLLLEAEKRIREIGYSRIYCLIIEQNNASKALVEKHRYSKKRELKICALSAYKKFVIAPQLKIERIKKNEIRDAVNLINEYNSGREHFIQFNPESFESYIKRIPAYGLENLWVVKDDGKIVACAGLWDCSILQKMCYTKEPFIWKVMRGLFGFLSFFSKMPKIPAEGEYFKAHYIADHAFQQNRPDAMLNLIRHLNNVLFDMSRDFFGTQLDPDDPLFEILKKFNPQIESLSVYAKAFERELPEYTSFYGDIRDAVL